MRRNRDDEPTPGSKWAILAALTEMQAEARAARLEADAARLESRALSMAILQRIEVLMRTDQSLIRKVNYTMSLADDFNSNLEVIKSVKLATIRSYELLGAKINAISGKLDAALADDAATAEERAALAAISSSLTTEAASLMETVVANTPAQAEPTPAPTESPVVVPADGGEPTVEPPVAEEPAPAEVPAEGSEPVAEQPATDPAPQQ